MFFRREFESFTIQFKHYLDTFESEHIQDGMLIGDNSIYFPVLDMEVSHDPNRTDVEYSMTIVNADSIIAEYSLDIVLNIRSIIRWRRLLAKGKKIEQELV